MKSIKFKFIFVYLALVFLVVIIGGTFMLLRINAMEKKKAENQLASAAKQIAEQYLMPPDLVNLYDNLESYANMNGAQEAYYAVIQNGKRLEAYPDTDRRATDPSIISASAGTAKFTTENSSDGGAPRMWYNYAYPVFDGERVAFVVFVSVSAEPVLDNLVTMGATIFLTFMLAMLLAAVFGVLLAGTMTGPIAALTRRARDMAYGRLDHELPINSEDEIGQLTESFNEMSRELNQSMSAITSEKNKLEILINNITDGVLAYDDGGRLIHANAACQELLNINSAETVPFSEMMELLGVEYRHIRDISSDLVKECALTGGRYITASFSTYTDTQSRVRGLVIVLQDITKHKKLDEMRKEFVANVSHEIRTPLATIKSYTETLLDGALESRQTAEEFLEIIDSEAERMTTLVKDLLELSRFDNRQMKLIFSDVDLIQVLKQSIRQNSVLAGQKNQVIEFKSIDGQKFWMKADAGRINQVFTNLISNALKYSSEYSGVEIFCAESPGEYRIYIRDHGIGIPREDLDRIFERFYRVDKARSRAMGGTGLGLAIAKEITEAHGGKISASSTLGEGTTMVLKFDRNFKPLEA
ncbi:MAG: cell wall metabolism sensor histidine kinase WalK [Clostridiales bacterium]|nr:cell wall metabolism sensor histidine kinase WalK [Clostridiales bacterium]